MRAVLLIAIGGGIGAVARWGGMELLPSTAVALLVVNTLGSCAIGLAFTQLDERYRDLYDVDAVISTRFHPLLVIGWLGSFTTYSSLALHLVHGLQDGHVGAAIALLVASLVLGIGGLALGVGLGRLWHVKRRRTATPSPQETS